MINNSYEASDDLKLGVGVNTEPRPHKNNKNLERILAAGYKFKDAYYVGCEIYRKDDPNSAIIYDQKTDEIMFGEYKLRDDLE